MLRGKSSEEASVGLPSRARLHFGGKHFAACMSELHCIAVPKPFLDVYNLTRPGDQLSVGLRAIEKQCRLRC